MHRPEKRLCHHCFPGLWSPSNQQRGRPSMNNNDLADVIAAGHGLTKTDARKVVDAVFAAVADAASQGDEISLNGFGKFKVKESAARDGRNPSTGATIQIAASKKLARSEEHTSELQSLMRISYAV